MDDNDRTRTARHEAGHALVAHALDEVCREVSAVPCTLAPDHPANSSGRAQFVWGYHYSQPSRQPVPGRGMLPPHEANAQLLRTAVISVGGIVAEENLPAPTADDDGAQHDRYELALAASALGRAQKRSGDLVVDPEFEQAVARAARTILADLDRPVDELAAILIAEGTLQGSALESALAGSQRGSHKYLIADLQAELRCDRPAQNVRRRA